MTVYELKQKMDEVEESRGTRHREDVLLMEIVKLQQRVHKLEDMKSDWLVYDWLYDIGEDNEL